MTHPQTRDTHRTHLLHELSRLARHIEADHTDHGRAEILARRICTDVQVYFDPDRWRPTAVFAELQAHVPLDTPLTLLIVHHEGAHGRQLVRGRVVAVRALPHPYDGARFEVRPGRHTRPQTCAYRAGDRASLTVYAGQLSPAQLAAARPLYQHAARRPLCHDAFLPHVAKDSCLDQTLPRPGQAARPDHAWDSPALNRCAPQTVEPGEVMS